MPKFAAHPERLISVYSHAYDSVLQESEAEFVQEAVFREAPDWLIRALPPAYRAAKVIGKWAVGYVAQMILKGIVDMGMDRFRGWVSSKALAAGQSAFEFAAQFPEGSKERQYATFAAELVTRIGQSEAMKLISAVETARHKKPVENPGTEPEPNPDHKPPQAWIDDPKNQRGRAKKKVPADFWKINHKGAKGEDE